MDFDLCSCFELRYVFIKLRYLSMLRRSRKVSRCSQRDARRRAATRGAPRPVAAAAVRSGRGGGTLVGGNASTQQAARPVAAAAARAGRGGGTPAGSNARKHHQDPGYQIDAGTSPLTLTQLCL